MNKCPVCSFELVVSFFKEMEYRHCRNPSTDNTQSGHDYIEYYNDGTFVALDFLSTYSGKRIDSNLSDKKTEIIVNRKKKIYDFCMRDTIKEYILNYITIT